LRQVANVEPDRIYLELADFVAQNISVDAIQKITCPRQLLIIEDPAQALECARPSRVTTTQIAKGALMNAHEIVATATRLLVERERPGTPWITVDEAATRARCGIKLIYREVRAGRLKAVRIGGRRELRLRPEWIDTWLNRDPMAHKEQE
jgi:excisionase family DNA binding protein